MNGTHRGQLGLREQDEPRMQTELGRSSRNKDVSLGEGQLEDRRMDSALIQSLLPQL